MTGTDVRPGTADAETSATAGVTCAACPHARDSHDVIAHRYCTATVAGNFNRRCVCVGGHGEPVKERS
ncbi:RGCVC family protein [Amycolatopsis sp. SID8362]|uniref:RGCVC family protein n=1 Tax=Amycolatopsis sp. SID8362 TaxID=2690346 RepID=UPI001941D973|nr:RGCVC family protein [Amycolatopsis sp. SID8362]